jgi:hypothetical protein
METVCRWCADRMEIRCCACLVWTAGAAISASSARTSQSNSIPEIAVTIAGLAPRCPARRHHARNESSYDVAVEHVLDTLAEVMPAGSSVRHRIEHIETLPSDQAPRFAELGVIAEAQLRRSADRPDLGPVRPGQALTALQACTATPPPPPTPPAPNTSAGGSPPATAPTSPPSPPAPCNHHQPTCPTYPSPSPASTGSSATKPDSRTRAASGS